MSKGMYLGVNGTAHKVKTMYVGVPKEIPTRILLHGETLTDSSGNAAAVTNNGATVVSDKSKFSGSSLYFNGSATLSIPININGDATVDLWVYPNIFYR